MTQPAVSQHIQFLENYYGVILIAEKGKNFSLTDEGKAFEQYVKTLKANSERILPLLDRIKNKSKPLNFGATLTIGEYTIPPILSQIFKEDPEIDISMHVENTHILQKMLWEGKIDFALLEGHFKGNEFEFDLPFSFHDLFAGLMGTIKESEVERKTINGHSLSTSSDTCQHWPDQPPKEY